MSVVWDRFRVHACPPPDVIRLFAFFYVTEMPHSYEHVVDAQQSTVGDELYNLTQLAEVSIVYFENHTAAIVENSKTFDKVSATRTPASVLVCFKRIFYCWTS